ncbi:MAG: response regulator [Bacteroidetes bacterium]|nr:response regulator [Bacteroidota bacterium]MBU1113967.1 response regulator [Bacteroidota bacterium]MBU1797305.1 response regulator [Bacteroidota bacterium]
MDKLLIVDDEFKLCATLAEDLNEIGYFTHFVQNVDDALKYIDSSEVSLILLDLKMPEKDGFCLLSEIQKREMDIKIIVLTANVDVESALKAATLGVDEYIMKPFKFDKLLLTIRRVMQKKSYLKMKT